MEGYNLSSRNCLIQLYMPRRKPCSASCPLALQREVLLLDGLARIDDSVADEAALDILK